MSRTFWCAALLVGFLPALHLARAADPLPNSGPAAPSAVGLVAPPAPDVVRTRTLEWVARHAGEDKARLEEVGRMWALGDQPPTTQELFDKVLATFSLVDDATRAFVNACRLERPALLAPEAALLEKNEAGDFYRANLSLFFGRYLVYRQMFEEALEVLNRTALADVVDPAALLFYKAVCQHHLLMKTEGLATIEQLLKNTENVPVRFATVATLMQYDLEALQERSLDEVSRKMTDVERRLTLGRAGQKVQKKEEEIVATLDEIIKRIEEQQGGGGGGGGSQNRSSSPAQDSVVKGSTAPGKVDPKKLKNEGQWGDLPPRARAKAKDLIAREFPAHYRDAIEEFTKKAAARPANSAK